MADLDLTPGTPDGSWASLVMISEHKEMSKLWTPLVWHPTPSQIQNIILKQNIFFCLAMLDTYKNLIYKKIEFPTLS